METRTLRIVAAAGLMSALMAGSWSAVADDALVSGTRPVDRLVIDTLSLRIGAAAADSDAMGIGGDATPDSAVRLRAWNKTSNFLLGSLSAAVTSPRAVGLGGIDYLISDKFIAGVAVGWEDRLDPSLHRAGSSRGRDYTVAPYAGMVINENFSADMVGGYAFGSSQNEDRIYDPLQFLGSGGTTEAGWDQWFIAGNVNGQYSIDRLTLTGRAGVLWVVEGQSQNLDAGEGAPAGQIAELGQVRIGGAIGYDLGRIEPYVTGAFAHDLEGNHAALSASSTLLADVYSGFEVGGGVNFAFSDAIVGGFQGTTQIGSDDSKLAATVSGNLRIKF